MHTEFVSYHDQALALEGYFAIDKATIGVRPAVLIAHDWTGRNEFACKKAEKIAALGYAGFALDMFGKGVLGRNNEEKSKLIAPLIEDRNLLLRRMQAAYNKVKTLPQVDEQRVVAIGFCFGGMCVLDLARSGADLRGVVSFHGLLAPPPFASQSIIRSKVLALHGHDDPMVKPDQVAQFQREMTEAQADWQIHIYGNTLHAFTNPHANDYEFGTVYNSQAEQRSWQAMQNFLMEVFA